MILYVFLCGVDPWAQPLCLQSDSIAHLSNKLLPHLAYHISFTFHLPKTFQLWTSTCFVHAVVAFSLNWGFSACPCNDTEKA